MINKSHWMSLPMSTRIKLSEMFNVPKSGHTHVAGNQIVDDGYTVQDLSALTLLKLQMHFNTEETNFYQLIDRVVHEIENPVQENHEETKSGEITNTTEPIKASEPQQEQTTAESGDGGTTEREPVADFSSGTGLPPAPKKLKVSSRRKTVHGGDSSVPPTSA